MAPQTNHGAKGEMILSYDWEESGSGHLETESKVVLKASPKGKFVDLVISSSSTNFIRSNDSGAGQSVYRISVQKLIEFIQSNGKSV